MLVAELTQSTRKGNELVKEDNNPFASPLSSSIPPLNDTPVTFPRRPLLGSLLVMVSWPMLGIAVCWGLSLFEKPSEAIFMFGSVTMIFLFPLAFAVSSEWIYGTLIGIVWLLVLFLPLCFGKRIPSPQIPCSASVSLPIAV